MATMKISGGDKLKAKLASIERNLSRASGVEFGFMENATYLDGTMVAMVAAIHNQESGELAKNIPPRPFFRAMINQSSPEWPDFFSDALVGFDYDSEKAFGALGGECVEQLKASILNFNGTPLSPKTIKAKGFDKQLVHTRNMLNSVTSRVIE